MKTTMTKARQNVYDLALQLYGTTQMAFKLSQDNGLPLDGDDVPANTSIMYDDSIGAPVIRNYFADNDALPNNFYEPHVLPVEVTYSALFKVDPVIAWVDRLADTYQKAVNDDPSAQAGIGSQTSIYNSSAIAGGALWSVRRGVLKSDIAPDFRTIVKARLILWRNNDSGAIMRDGGIYRYTGDTSVVSYDAYAEFAEQLAFSTEITDTLAIYEFNATGIALIQNSSTVYLMGRSSNDISAVTPLDPNAYEDTFDIAISTLEITREVN